MDFLNCHLQITSVLFFPFHSVFSFSGLITLGRISNTKLNRSVESGHSYLVLDPTGKFSVLHQLSMMLDVGFS